MRYRSTRSDESLEFKEAFLKNHGDLGGDFLPEMMPELSYAAFSALDFPGRVALILERYCPDIAEADRFSIVQAVTSEDVFPEGVYRAARLNSHAEDRYLLELDRGPSGFCHDFAMALYFALLTHLKGDTTYTSVLGPFPEEQAAFDAARARCSTPELYPAIFLSARGTKEPSFLTVTNEDQFWYLKGERCRIEAFPKTVLRQYAKPSLRADGGSLAYLLAALILLGSALADLDAKEELKGPVDLVLPIMSLAFPLAGLYLKSLGFPIDKLVLVNSRNHQIADFITSGKLSLRRRYLKSEAEEMERLIPAHLERLIFELSGRSTEVTSSFFETLSAKRQASLDRELVKAWSQHLLSCFGSERTAEKIQDELYHETDYLMDRYSLMCFVGDKHRKKHHGSQQLYLLLGRPWKGFECSVEDIQELANEAGTTIPDYVFKAKEKAPFVDYDPAFLKEGPPFAEALPKS